MKTHSMTQLTNPEIRKESHLLPFFTSVQLEVIWLLFISLGSGLSVSLFLQIATWLKLETPWVMNFVLIIPTLFYWLYKRRFIKLKKFGIGMGVLVLGFFSIYDSSFTNSSISFLLFLHIPLGLWFLTGYVVTEFKNQILNNKLAFVAYSGNTFIFYGLLGIGGMVVVGTLALLFQSQGLDLEPFFEQLLLPVGATGAFFVASWLSDTHQAIISRIGLILTRILVPLLGLVLGSFLLMLVIRGQGFAIDRDGLILYNILLVLVYCLSGYSLVLDKSYGPSRLHRWFLLLLILLSLIVNGVAIFALGSRLIDYGISPNRITTLVINLLLLVNLAGSGYLLLISLRNNQSYTKLYQWQGCYLHVFAAWVGFVIFFYPLLF